MVPSDRKIAKRFARALRRRCSSDAIAVTVFGSRARGDADEESDLDLFVEVDRDDRAGEVKAAAIDIACDLTIETGTLVNAFVADREFLETHRGYSLLEAIEEEGIPL